MAGSRTASGKVELYSLDPRTPGFNFHHPEKGMNAGASHPEGAGLVLPSSVLSFVLCVSSLIREGRK